MNRQLVSLTPPVNHLLILLVSLVGYFSPVNAQTIYLSQIEKCREESSALVRLDCYDKISTPNFYPGHTGNIERSQYIQQALQQELQRAEHSTDFIVTQQEGLFPEVIITTPALGQTPPRPILVFSCLEHITRMQLILFTPLANANGSLTLKTNTGTKITTHWFVRDHGYLLESSRGLPGISDIQKILGAETLFIESEYPEINGLSFNIKELNKEIQPLRQACKW